MEAIWSVFTKYFSYSLACRWCSGLNLRRIRTEADCVYRRAINQLQDVPNIVKQATLSDDSTIWSRLAIAYILWPSHFQISRTTQSAIIIETPYKKLLFAWIWCESTLFVHAHTHYEQTHEIMLFSHSLLDCVQHSAHIDHVVHSHTPSRNVDGVDYGCVPRNTPSSDINIPFFEWFLNFFLLHRRGSKCENVAKVSSCWSR